MTSFDFNIITNSTYFKALLSLAYDSDWVRDVCHENLSVLSQEQIDKLTDSDLIHLVQKSPVWLNVREKAFDTASSCGKYLWRSSVRFPTRLQVAEKWQDKLSKAPFTKNHTMLGHTTWGICSEDVALIQFCHHTGLSVAQVGTIKLPIEFVFRVGQELFPKMWLTRDQWPANIEQDYLLVSPDGVVGKPEGKKDVSIRRDLYQRENTLGMLEIKCISPFYYQENANGCLTWEPDLNKRQWMYAERIPFEYVIQLTLQALSGLHRLDMNSNHWMWFIRWSPNNFMLYRFSFYHLFRLGVWAIAWRYYLGKRLNAWQGDELGELSKQLTSVGHEITCSKQTELMYHELMTSAVSDYQELACYPEFNAYHNSTENHEFVVGENENVTFGLGHTL